MKKLIFGFCFIFLNFFIFSNEKNKLFLTLEKAKQIALSNNIDIRLDKIQKSILKQALKDSYRVFFPSVKILYNNNETVRKFSLDSRSQTFQIGLEQLVYDGGLSRLAFQLSNLDIKLQNHQIRGTVHQLMMNVRESYFRLIQAKDNLDVQKKSLERSKLQLKLSKREYSLGVLSKIDFLEVKARLVEIEIQQLRGMRDYKSSIAKFKLLISLSKNTEIILDDTTIDKISIKKPKVVLKKLLSLAFNNRPDLDQQKVASLKARKEYIIAKTYYLPRVFLTSNYSMNGDRFPPLEKGWSFGVRVSTRLGGSSLDSTSNINSSKNFKSKGFSNNNNVDLLNQIGYKKDIFQKTANLQKAKVQEQQLLDKIYIEIEDDISKCDLNFKIHEVTKIRKELVFQRLEIEIQKTNLGELKRVDLMETEIEYLKVAIAAIQSKTEYIISVNTLENAMGVAPDFLKLIEYE